MNRYKAAPELSSCLVLPEPLTQKTIDSTPLPAQWQVTLRDHEQRGLALRVWPAGTRPGSFEYRSPVTGKNFRSGLPAGTLAQARTIAQVPSSSGRLGERSALEAHIDLEARREAHAKAATVEATLYLYEPNVVSGR